MASTSETGLQLFARLVSRPSLDGIDDALFPDGLRPKDVIEVSGEVSCGKTLLLSQLVVKCILPKELGGLEAEAVLLNTDHHFQVHKLVSLMEGGLLRSGRVPPAEMEDVIKRSLARLILYNINDSTQLQVTFHAVQTLVLGRPRVAIILLDSVSAFYWQDVMAGGIRKMDLYVKNVMKTLQKTVADFKGVMVYTRPAHFQSKVSEVGCANWRVILKPTGQDNLFSATVESSSGTHDMMFTISSAGIQWLTA